MSGFKDVVGHKNIIKYIQNAVTADAVSHAYILNGERGSGKKLLANLFAMSLQCENRDEDGDACGKCRSCRQAAGGNQPDIIRIMHEKPNTIGVGDIRTQVNDDIMIRPYSSKYKIYIIADADMMSVEAQNALLKTIEEPPEYAVIMLLTENAETLLPTIRSRCVMMKLRNIKDQLVKKYLMEQLEVPGVKMGGKIETFTGLTGIGDLIVTCTSVHSRNRKAGYLIGQGRSMQEAMDEVQMVVEGVYSAKAAAKLAKKYDVPMPIVEEVNKVLFEGKSPAEAVDDLMLRESRSEHRALQWEK